MFFKNFIVVAYFSYPLFSLLKLFFKLFPFPIDGFKIFHSLVLFVFGKLFDCIQIFPVYLTTLYYFAFELFLECLYLLVFVHQLYLQIINPPFIFYKLNNWSRCFMISTWYPLQAYLIISSSFTACCGSWCIIDGFGKLHLEFKIIVFLLQIIILCSKFIIAFLKICYFFLEVCIEWDELTDLFDCFLVFDISNAAITFLIRWCFYHVKEL